MDLARCRALNVTQVSRKFLALTYFNQDNPADTRLVMQTSGGSTKVVYSTYQVRNRAWHHALHVGIMLRLGDGGTPGQPVFRSRSG